MALDSGQSNATGSSANLERTEKEWKELLVREAHRSVKDVLVIPERNAFNTPRSILDARVRP